MITGSISPVSPPIAMPPTTRALFPSSGTMLDSGVVSTAWPSRATAANAPSVAVASTRSIPAPKATFAAKERCGRCASGRSAPDSADMDSPLPAWGPLEDNGTPFPLAFPVWKTARVAHVNNCAQWAAGGAVE